MVNAAPVFAFRGIYNRPTLAPIPRYHRKIDDLILSGERNRLNRFDQSRLSGQSQSSRSCPRDRRSDYANIFVTKKLRGGAPLRRPLERRVGHQLRHVDKLFWRDFSLAQQPGESTNLDLAVHRDHTPFRPASHDDVTSGLTNLHETKKLKRFNDCRTRCPGQLRHSPGC